MKKLAIVAVCLIATVAAYGQGQVNLANRNVATGLDAPIFDFSGNKLDSGFLAQLYVNDAAVGPTAEFRDGAGAGYIRTVAVDTGQPYGTEVTVMVKAWDAAEASFEAAQGAGLQYGASDAIVMNVSGITGGVPDLPVFIDGLQSFSLVPEPSTIALGLLGAAILFLRRRK
jgi:hypothetical protein